MASLFGVAAGRLSRYLANFGLPGHGSGIGDVFQHLSPLIPAAATVAPDLAIGLSQISSAPVILLLQILWIALFLYYGRSRVTASTLSFHVVADRI